MEISKKDYKLFCEKSQAWQERYMRRLCELYKDILNSSYSASVKWNTLYERMMKDKGNPGVTMDMDKNMIGMNLVNLFQSGVITEEDLEGFSSDFRKWAVSFMSD